MACILVIDDDLEIRDIMRRVLEGAGYTVFEARTGREGIHLCQTSSIALVITDMFMPDYDGVDLLRAVQSCVPVPQVIAISGAGRRSRTQYPVWRGEPEKFFWGEESLRMSQDRIEALKQLLEQEPHDTMLLFGLGNEYFGAGHYAEAIPYFEEAVRVDPAYAAVYVYLARAYEETDQPEMVRQTLERGWEPAVRSGDQNLIDEIEAIRERL